MLEEFNIDPVASTPSQKRNDDKRPRANSKRFQKVLKQSSANVIRLGILIVTVLVLTMIIKEVTNANYSIESVNVPEYFEKAGYSGTVVSDRIFYQLKRIIDAERVSDIAAEYEEATRGIDLNVEVVGIGIPVRSVTDVLSKNFNIGNRRVIVASITIDADTAILNVMIEGRVEKRIVVQKAGMEQLVSRLTLEAARIILKYSHPYALARHLILRDAEGMHDLGNYLLTEYEDDPKMEPLGYYAMAGAYLTDGRYQVMESLVREALKKYPKDLNMQAALGTCLLYQKRYPEAKVQQLKIISLLEENTPLNRVGKSYFNMALLMNATEQLDSARYYAKQSISFDRDFAEPYVLIASTYLAEKDTTEAIKWVKRGLILGFPAKDLMSAYGFVNVRHHPEFDALIARYGRQ